MGIPTILIQGFIIALALQSYNAWHEITDTSKRRTPATDIGFPTGGTAINSVNRGSSPVVGFCPRTCKCDISKQVHSGTSMLVLTIQDCSEIPIEEEIVEILSTYEFVSGVAIVHTGIFSFPCQTLRMTLSYLDLSHNAIQTPVCGHWDILLEHPHISNKDIVTIPSAPFPVYLDLSYNYLSAVWSSMLAFQYVKVLDLSHNNIGRVSCDLSVYMEEKSSYDHLNNLSSNLPNPYHLTHLNLSDNQIKTLSCDIFSPHPLKILNLSKNKLKMVSLVDCYPRILTEMKGLANDQKACELSKLSHLNISSNYFKTFNVHQWGVENLEQLDLSRNYMRTLSCETLSLPHLKWMSVNNNKLNSVDCNISSSSELVSELEELNLRHNQFDTMPCALSVLPKLQSMDLSHNQIHTILCDLSKMTSLRKLDLTHNRLDTIPNGLCAISNLQSLYLGHNKIQAVPHDLSRLVSLRYLDLEYNNLYNIPCSLSTLSTLESLYLGNNQIVNAPCDLSGLKSLRTLDLRFNRLKVIPQNISTLPKIQILDLRNNNVHTVPSYFADLSSLNHLDLSHNSIETFPCHVSTFLNLGWLDLSHNRIQTVPCNTSDVTIIDHLNLSFNRISVFPCHLLGGTFNLSHNNIDSVLCNLSGYRIETLDLSFNSFQTFPCDLLMLLVDELELRHNNIDKVACDMSGKLPYRLLPWSLDFGHNNLKTIPCDLSKTQVGHLFLDHNHIHTLHPCLYNFKSLSRISLDFNDFSIIGNKYFFNLYRVELFLRNNKLSHIINNGFWNHEPYSAGILLDNNYLQVLDSWPLTFAKRAHETTLFTMVASNNQISEFTNFHQLSVTSCNNISHCLFHFNNNHIRYIRDLFSGWNLGASTKDEIHHCMKAFDFTDNPLVCDCTDYDVYLVIHGKRDYLSKNLTCQEPYHLKGLNPAFVTLDKFVCNVSEKCPQGCLCYNTPHTRNLSVICTHYNKTELPIELPDLPNEKYWYYLTWTGTNLQKISNRSYFKKAVDAIFSYNDISDIDIVSLLSSANIAKVFLEHNRLRRLSNTIASLKLGSDIEVKLSGNPWVCDCEALVMKNWLIRNYENIQDLNNVRCFLPPNTRGKLMIYVDDSVMCPQDSHLTLAMAIIGGIAVFLLICLPLICIIRIKRSVRDHTREDWEPMNWDDEVNEGKEFDVFVSYANEDEEYVGGYLIPELENRGFKVCFHRVHFLGGKSIIDNICECIAKSKKVLAFYSPHYKESDFGMFEYTMAMQLDVQNATNRLVTIVDTDLDIENLQLGHSTYLRTHTYVIQEEQNFWRNLLYNLPKYMLGEVLEEHEID